MRAIDNLREHLKGVARSLDASVHGSKTEVAKRYAEELGVTPQTLYRMMQREIGYCSGRKTRADKGNTSISDEALHFVAALQKTQRRKNGKLVMARPMAKALAAQAGYIGDVSVGHLGRLLRDRGLDADTVAQRAPHIEMRSMPNGLMQVDPSLCLIYYLHGKQHIIREDVFYKNKPNNIAKIKLKVWRYVAVDHASNTIFVRYFEQAGETQHALFRFLIHCWTKQPGRPAHGVPRHLMMDPGSANTAYGIRNLCAALEVELIINKPRRPWGKGGVEGAQQIIETHFECLLSDQPVNDVDELNAAASAWENAYNANLIPQFDSCLNRAGLQKPTSRTDLWMKIDQASIRQCPPFEVCAALMRGAASERMVSSALTVRYRHPAAAGTMTYDLRNIRELRAGETVQIRPLIYGDEAVVIEFQRYDGTNHSYRIEPIREYDEMGRRMDSPMIGEYKSLPQHDLEYTQQHLDQLAYGIDSDGVIRDAEAIEKAKENPHVRPFAHLNGGMGLRPLDVLQGIEMPNFLPKKGVPITPKVAEMKFLDSLGLEAEGSALSVPSSVQLDDAALRLCHLEMAQRLASALADNWSAVLYEQMVELYPAGVVYEEMPAVIDRFKRQVLASQMRVINGGAA